MVVRILKIQHVSDIIDFDIGYTTEIGDYMADKKEYRSAIRSRKLIRQAFLELLKEKNLEKITVTDIVKRADINRSTFYAHYPDVMGVIDEIQEEILDYCQKMLDKVDFSEFFENPSIVLKDIIKILEENHELYRLLMHSTMATKQLEQIKFLLLEKTMNNSAIAERYKDRFEFEFKLRFFMGGVVDVYSQWLNNELDCSLNDLTEQIAKLIVSVSDDFLDK